MDDEKALGDAKLARAETERDAALEALAKAERRLQESIPEILGSMKTSKGWFSGDTDDGKALEGGLSRAIAEAFHPADVKKVSTEDGEQRMAPKMV